MQLSDLIKKIQKIAPLRAAAEWDNSGMQVLGTQKEVSLVAVTLDPTLPAVAEAAEYGAEFILTHHPLSFKPRPLGIDSSYLEIVRVLLSSGISLYSAHTSLDANPAGPAAWLVRELNIGIDAVLEKTWVRSSVSFRIEANDREKAAVLAEKWKNVPGVLKAGVVRDEVELTAFEEDWPEIRANIIKDAPESLFHQTLAVLPDCVYGFGCVGDLPTPMETQEFLQRVASLVPAEHWTMCGDLPAKIRRAAVCPGSGASLADKAFNAGADILITGDVKYHAALEASGFLLDVGHFSLEEEMMRRFCATLQKELPGVEFRFIPSTDPLRLYPVKRKDGTSAGTVS